MFRRAAWAAAGAGCATAAIWLGGCRDRAAEPDRGSGGTGSEAVPDSLALSAPGGVEVWYTLARQATDAAGKPCVERSLEIRRGSTRVPIPLLYTSSPVELVDDTTVRARLSDRCRPGDRYRVDLRRGQPVRERKTGSPR